MPRRNQGPIITLNQAAGTAISVQYAGFSGTREMQAFRSINRAGNLTQFTAALQSFDVGSQNFIYADKQGDIAYFAAGEMPLREDLENGAPVGLPPFLIRDGQGGNEWLKAQDNDANRALPFAILPFNEMPQLINPPRGFIVNANNDPDRQQPRQQRAQRAATRWRHSLHRFGLYLRPGHPRRTHRAAVDIVAGERPETRGCKTCSVCRRMS